MRLLVVLAALPFLLFAPPVAAKTSVWKVTGPTGGTLFLAGTVHALRSQDYPLPAAFNRAFDEASILAFEVDAASMKGSMAHLLKAGTYPAGDEMKNHVDPRTWTYIRKVLGPRVPESAIAKYRPWFLSLLMSLPRGEISYDLGVERYFEGRAKATRKSTVGLESGEDHARVYSGLNDRESEAVLLLLFIRREGIAARAAHLPAHWRAGEADEVWRILKSNYADFPGMGVRLLEDRNRAWLPKIEGWLRSGKIYIVAAGGGHMGGPGGLVALLRGRGYTVEQW